MSYDWESFVAWSVDAHASNEHAMQRARVQQIHNRIPAEWKHIMWSDVVLADSGTLDEHTHTIGTAALSDLWRSASRQVRSAGVVTTRQRQQQQQQQQQQKQPLLPQQPPLSQPPRQTSTRSKTQQPQPQPRQQVAALKQNNNDDWTAQFRSQLAAEDNNNRIDPETSTNVMDDGDETQPTQWDVPNTEDDNKEAKEEEEEFQNVPEDEEEEQKEHDSTEEAEEEEDEEEKDEEEEYISKEKASEWASSLLTIHPGEMKPILTDSFKMTDKKEVERLNTEYNTEFDQLTNQLQHTGLSSTTLEAMMKLARMVLKQFQTSFEEAWNWLKSLMDNPAQRKEVVTRMVHQQQGLAFQLSRGVTTAWNALIKGIQWLGAAVSWIAHMAAAMARAAWPLAKWVLGNPNSARLSLSLLLVAKRVMCRKASQWLRGQSTSIVERATFEEIQTLSKERLEARLNQGLQTFLQGPALDTVFGKAGKLVKSLSTNVFRLIPGGAILQGISDTLVDMTTDTIVDSTRDVLEMVAYADNVSESMRLLWNFIDPRVCLLQARRVEKELKTAGFNSSQKTVLRNNPSCTISLLRSRTAHTPLVAHTTKRSGVVVRFRKAIARPQMVVVRIVCENDQQTTSQWLPQHILIQAQSGPRRYQRQQQRAKKPVTLATWSFVLAAPFMTGRFVGQWDVILPRTTQRLVTRWSNTR